MLNGACHPPVCQTGGREAASATLCPLQQPGTHFPATASPSIPSPTLLWVLLELGNVANGSGLDGLSDTELDRGSVPFSWEGAGSKHEPGSSSPGLWEWPLERRVPHRALGNPPSPHIIPSKLQAQ